MDYTVRPGDCLSSIAKRFGYSWRYLYDHPDNAEFKKKRPDPNLIYPGDVLKLPDKGTKKVSVSSGRRHTFVRKSGFARLRVRFLMDDKPRKNEQFLAVIDYKTGVSDCTDNEGLMDIPIPPDAAHVEVWFGSELDGYTLDLGHLDPVEEIDGVQARLINLGYDCPLSGKLDERTRRCLEAFQHEAGLSVSGDNDEPTRNKLKELHGC